MDPGINEFFEVFESIKAVMSHSLLFLLNQTSVISPCSHSTMCQSLCTDYLLFFKNKTFRANYTFRKLCCFNKLRHFLFYSTQASGYAIHITLALSIATGQ